MSAEKQRLGNLVNIKTGKLDANASSPNGVYPFFTCSRDPLKIDKFSYDCECVLVAGNGDLNVKYYQGKFDAYQRTYIIESKDKKKLDVRYLYYFLDTYLETLRIQSIGGVIKYIKLENLSDAQIPLPPLPIQKRIAEILDAADALRKKDQELLKKYDELAQAIFIDMFGDPVKNEKGWEVKTIQDVTDNYDSFRKPVKSSDREKLQGAYPYYGATGIIDYVNEFLLDGEFLLISEDGKNLVGRYKKIAFIADGKFWVNNHAHVLKAKENCNDYYLEFYLNKIDLSPFVTGIDQFKLNRSNLDIVPVLVPPKKQQDIFELLVKDIEFQKRNTLKQIENSARLFHTMIQKAFSGELVS